jgi:hypothetical protein
MRDAFEAKILPVSTEFGSLKTEGGDSFTLFLPRRDLTSKIFTCCNQRNSSKESWEWRVRKGSLYLL